MNPTLLRNLAQQTRELLPRAHTDATRAQLLIWITEFEEQAEVAERELATGGAPVP
jgi:hypothetical protein